VLTTCAVYSCNPGGIGNALAREFHSNGLRVFATARSRDSIKDLSELGIETLSLEVNDAGNVERLREEVSALTGGKLDYLVNNAGRSRSSIF
jgi:1-acylglycerone phosphate reductase